AGQDVRDVGGAAVGGLQDRGRLRRVGGGLLQRRDVGGNAGRDREAGGVVGRRGDARAARQLRQRAGFLHRIDVEVADRGVGGGVGGNCGHE
ncbi:hypothetical protein chiPu_0032563, partial [Chiloscyllium punctatum]|nr:hypothetical protein [Chiloscyllium punctatum]